MSEFEIHYFADKVFVHRWPKNSPSWSDSLQKKLDLLLQEKEISDQITNKVKLENNNLKNQLSKNKTDAVLNVATHREFNPQYINLESVKTNI